MQNSVRHQVVCFFRFMQLFRVSFFSLIRIEADRIQAIVAWPEDCSTGIPEPEDTQEVVWQFDYQPDLDDAICLGEYAYDTGAISSDRIQLDAAEIQQQLRWDADRYSKATEKLFQIRVTMVDDGKETDGFFLHG